MKGMGNMLKSFKSNANRLTQKVQQQSNQVGEKVKEGAQKVQQQANQLGQKIKKVNKR